MDDPRLDAIVAMCGRRKEGFSVQYINAMAVPAVPRRTLQSWLARLVAVRRLKVHGGGWNTRYYVPQKPAVGEKEVAPKPVIIAPTQSRPAAVAPAQSAKLPLPVQTAAPVSNAPQPPARRQIVPPDPELFRRVTEQQRAEDARRAQPPASQRPASTPAPQPSNPPEAQAETELEKWVRSFLE